MKSIIKKIAATTAAMVMLSGSTMAVTAETVTTTLTTYNNLIYAGSISAKNKAYSVTKCKNGSKVYSGSIVPEHSLVKYTLEGTTNSNTVTVSKNNDNKKEYSFYTSIETCNLKTGKATTEKSQVTTKDAGCGLSRQRNSSNADLRYTMEISAGQTNVLSSDIKILRLIVNQK